MKKYATLFLVVMVSASSSLFGQKRTETTVKLEWQEQGSLHFYTDEYSVFISKPEFLDFQSELFAGIFDEFSQTKDSIDLNNPFPVFKTEQQNLLWSQLMHCASEGHMLILPTNSKKKLKTVVIIDDKSVQGSAGTIWECRDPKTNQVIFAHSVASVGAPNF
jgi:hypothetical protein